MSTDPQLIDVRATPQTVALYRNLKKHSENHILFGHQHATEYGRGWAGDPDRSDVKSVVETHPAVIGVDLQGLSGHTREDISKNKETLRRNIVATYDRGGLTTLSWHMMNPVTGGDFYWKNSPVPAVNQIIPGGSFHEQYREILTDIADFAHIVAGEDGTLAPMIFRPFHEFDGDWFWWGKPHCSKEEFITLWRFTVSHLRDTLGVHNFIYAFSPDCLFETEGEYLDRYPGDAWVDLLGMDDYADFGRGGTYHLETGVRKLQIVSNYARQANKLAAFTETGLESLAVPNWWTDTLLAVLKRENVKLCYVLVWRNDSDSPTHYYAPHPGHPSVPDFVKFSQDPLILLERDLPPLYTLSGAG